MKGKKHSAEQIIKKLREADVMIATGKSLGQVCQALEVSEQTFHRWRNQYGGMKAEEAKRLKELEDENKRLKKLLAEAEELLSKVVDGVFSGGGLGSDSIGENDAGDDVGQQLRTVQQPPVLGRGFHQFEDHREACLA
jgi:putative transposase